jgi:hypothetical protein
MPDARGFDWKLAGFNDKEGRCRDSFRLYQGIR